MKKRYLKLSVLLVLAFICPWAEAKEKLQTQYIAPVDNPTWESAVIKGEWGTGKGITYQRQSLAGGQWEAYCNYYVKIGENAYYAFDVWRAFYSSPDSYTRSVLYVVPSDPEVPSPAQRYLYPCPDVSKMDLVRDNIENNDYFENQTILNNWDSSPAGAVYVQKVHTDWRYTIKFNANGGSGVMDDQKIVNFGTLVANVFTRSGYTFSGWESGGVVYTDGDEIAPDDDVVLNAQWDANTYTITYDGNGHTSGSMNDSTSIKYDEEYTLSANLFEKTDSEFLGWALSPDGSVVYGNRQAVKNLTAENGKVVLLYAVWGNKRVVVEFDGNGGDVPFPASKNVMFGEKYGELATVKRDGFSSGGKTTSYTFTGWYTASIGGDLITAESVVSERTDHRLYAQWSSVTTANVYTVTLDPTGGEVDTTKMSVTHGENYPVLPEPEKSGYVFAGWWNAAGEQKTPLDIVTEDSLELYARWKSPEPEAETVNVVFDFADGSGREIFVQVNKGDWLRSVMPADPEHGLDPTGKVFIGWFSGNKRIAGDMTVECDGRFSAKWSERYYNDIFNCYDVLFATDTPDHPWIEDGENSLRSASDLASDEKSRLKAEFFSAGRLSFEWEASITVMYQFLRNDFWLSINGNKEIINGNEVSLENGFSSGEFSDREVAPSSVYEFELYAVLPDTEDYARVFNFSWKADESFPIDEWDSAITLSADPVNAAFKTGGTTNWFVTGDVVDAGENASAITNLAPSLSSWASMTVTGPGELRFKWKVSCERGYVDTNGEYRKCDYLEFLDGDRTIAFIDGDSDGFVEVVYTNAVDSAHEFMWRYVKDASGAEGEDAAYVDSVSWRSLVAVNPDPEEKDAPSAASALFDSSGVFTVSLSNVSEKFDYRVRGTGNLTDPEPWPVVLDRIPGAAVISVPLPSDPGKKQMFYRFEVIRKED